MSENLVTFLRSHPAFLYGLAALLGSVLSTEKSSVIAIPLCAWLLGIVLCRKNSDIRERMGLSLLLMASTAIFTKGAISHPVLSEEGITGKGLFHPTSLRLSATHFGTRWTYKGNLKQFEGSQTHYNNIPVQIHLKDSIQTLRPPADRDYLLEGTLREIYPGSYDFILKKGSPWIPVLDSISLAEIRWKAKKTIAGAIKGWMDHARCGAFLAGVATGELDDKLLAYELGRFGLQHIMAVSGFHFAILASILGWILRFLFPQKVRIPILMLILSSYFVMLGCSPSIIRAWGTIVIVLSGLIMEQRGSGLNSLGLMTIAILLLDPGVTTRMGFQFSFLITASILLLYPCFEGFTDCIFPKRRLTKLIRMGKWDQHGYCFLSAVRQGGALILAVNATAAPLMLYHFGKFPLLSLVYNLFFPFLTGISMFLLLLGSFFNLFCYWLAKWIHKINDAFTTFTLDIVYNLPTRFDVSVYVPEVPAAVIVLYITLILFLGMATRGKPEEHAYL